jgi:hypothetical protein
MEREAEDRGVARIQGANGRKETLMIEEDVPGLPRDVLL